MFILMAMSMRLCYNWYHFIKCEKTYTEGILQNHTAGSVSVALHATPSVGRLQGHATCPVSLYDPKVSSPSWSINEDSV